MKNKLLLTTALLSFMYTNNLHAKDAQNMHVDQNVLQASKTVFFEAASINTSQENPAHKEIIAKTFELLTDQNAPVDEFSKTISKRYIQEVNGKRLDYQHFLNHMVTLKEAVKSIEITFHEVIFADNKVVTRHSAAMTKKDGSESIHKVIAIFEIDPSEGKIISCRELTHMSSGNQEDRDLGSRTSK